MESPKRLPLVLFFCRVSVFLVFLLWGLDKFLRPDHAKAVFDMFYQLKGLGQALIYVLGGLQLLVVFMFLFGIRKKLSYGLVFVMHLISTLSCIPQYLSPYTEINLLFFAAWPMLAACFALYALREHDTIMTVK